MLRTLNNFIRYKLGRKLGTKAARKLGLGSLAGTLGVLAGMKAMKMRRS